MEFITAYGPKNKSAINFGDKSRTKQSEAKDADINIIMAKYVKTGILEHANKYQGSYSFATSEDFHSSMIIVQKAQEMFSELPATVRTKFHNNPAEFLDFVQDPENESQLYDLGLSDIPMRGPEFDRVDPEKPEGEESSTDDSADA